MMMTAQVEGSMLVKSVLCHQRNRLELSQHGDV